MLQTKTFKITRKHKKNAADIFQETVSLFVPSCIEKFTSERKVAFRSLLVQVETEQMSTVETGQMSSVETRQISTVEPVLSQQSLIQRGVSVQLPDGSRVGGLNVGSGDPGGG